MNLRSLKVGQSKVVAANLPSSIQDTIDDYNASVKEYNTLIGKEKSLQKELHKAHSEYERKQESLSSDINEVWKKEQRLQKEMDDFEDRLYQDFYKDPRFNNVPSEEKTKAWDAEIGTQLQERAELTRET